jgi:Fur family ferric uptake transcriptional regulator
MLSQKQIFLNYLKKKDLKWSRQREFIVDLFLSANRHVTTEELYQTAVKEFPEIGYSTVHRTLKLLSECGLASERHFSDRYTRFERKQKDQHHDHLICTECGKIIEFECDKIEKMQANIARQKGFKVTHHRLELYGFCSRCKRTIGV